MRSLGGYVIRTPKERLNDSLSDFTRTGEDYLKRMGIRRVVRKSPLKIASNPTTGIIEPENLILPP